MKSCTPSSPSPCWERKKSKNRTGLISSHETLYPSSPPLLSLLLAGEAKKSKNRTGMISSHETLYPLLPFSLLGRGRKVRIELG